MRPLRAAFSYERSTHLDDQSVAADPTRLGGVIEPQLVGEVDTRYRARLSTYQNLLTSAIEANHQGSKVTLNVTAGQVCYIVVDGCNLGFQLERDPTVVGTERGEQRDPVVLGRTGCRKPAVAVWSRWQSRRPPRRMTWRGSTKGHL